MSKRAPGGTLEKLNRSRSRDPVVEKAVGSDKKPKVKATEVANMDHNQAMLNVPVGKAPDKRRMSAKDMFAMRKAEKKAAAQAAQETAAA